MLLARADSSVNPNHDREVSCAFFFVDLPSVLSRDRLAVIDPHEKYFKYKGQGTTGYSWKLKERNADLAAIPAQTQPFMNLYNCDQSTFTQGNYNGTLFRFRCF